MKKKRMLVLSIFTVFIMTGGIILFKFWTPFFSYTEKIMGIYIVQEDITAGKERLSAEGNPGIFYEGVLLPFDKASGTLYLAQSIEAEQWEGHITTTLLDRTGEKFYICAPADEMWNCKTDAIREGYGYKVWIICEDSFYEFRLVVTGDPVIAIRTGRQEIPEAPTYEEDPDGLYFGSEPLFYGNITVFDPDMSEEGYTITEAGICYHEKGATTKIVPKKSYSIELLDENEEGVNISLLGMRKDNKWKLNSLYLDENRIREMTATQIWESFDAADTQVSEPGPRMEYAELILDDQYMGIYALVEPVDRKKLQLGNEDILYKIIEWGVPDDEGMQESADRGWRIAYPIRIRYPKEIADYDAVWAPIRYYLKLYYREGPRDYAEALSLIDKNNIIDYSLFLMAVSASDNSYKNTFLAVYCRDDEHTVLQIPWDLDYTFGNVYRYATIPVQYNSDTSAVYISEVLLRLYELNPQEIGPLVWERWSDYRSTFLSEHAIRELFEKNRDYLIMTGAINREMQRWPETNVNIDIDSLLEHQETRLDWLDDFFSQWAECE